MKTAGPENLRIIQYLSPKMAINAKFKVYCIFERVLMENHSNEFGDKPWYVTTLSVLQRCGNQRSRKNLVDFWEFFLCNAYTRSGLFEWSVWFLVIFSSLDDRIDLKLHILTELNGAHNSAWKSLMSDHSKIRKMPFWMIQIAKMRFLALFLTLVDWINSISHMMVVLNVS